MNIFEYAMKMEQDGREFYLENAEKTDNPAFKQILTQLANDELKHYNIFKALKEGRKAEYKEAEQTTIITTMKNVFDELKAQNKEFVFAYDAKAIGSPMKNDATGSPCRMSSSSWIDPTTGSKMPSGVTSMSINTKIR